MVYRGLISSGCTNKKLFIGSKNLDGHAMKSTRQNQDKFYAIEKEVPSDAARETFKRKPFS